MTDNRELKPQPTFNVIEAGAVVVGIVIGVGIFKTPALVAANLDSELSFLLIWLFGGSISFLGALCYAELATAYPHPGGEYHYLTRSFGREIAFLFAWERLSVMQTGSISLLAFVFGDYLSQLVPLPEPLSLALPERASGIYAALCSICPISSTSMRSWRTSSELISKHVTVPFSTSAGQQQ